MTMSNFDANSLLSDPAPLWFDGPLSADALLADALAASEPGRPALAVVAPVPADPLAQALPWLVRHLGVAAAVEAVVGPVDDERPAASAAVLPALRRIGFDAHLQRRSLASFAKADLPTILMLHSGDACVLTERWQDQQGQAWCNVVLPGPQPDEFSSAEAEIESAYSGMALVVSPPRPPFASALARARLAAAEPAAPAPRAAAVSAADGHADALVALAAAMQNAQRAMQASRSDPVPAAAAVAAQRPLGPARALSSRAGAAAQPLDGPADSAHPTETAAYSPPSAGADDAAAVLQLRFMQTGPVASTPRQALALLARAAGLGLRHALAGVRDTFTGALRATVPHLRQGVRRLGGLAGLGLQGSRRVGRALQGGLRRVGHALQTGLRRLWQCGLHKRMQIRLELARRQGLGLQGQWLRRRRHRQALQALGPAAQPLPQPGPGGDGAAAAAAAGAAPACRAGDRVLLRQVRWALPGASLRMARPGLGGASVLRSLAAGSALPGLAAGSALCLLVGAPLAWAPMVSGSSLQALRAAPQLLRGAFTADLDRAAGMLAGQARAQRAAGIHLPDRPARLLQADNSRVEPRMAADAGRNTGSRPAAAGQGGAVLQPGQAHTALRVGRGLPRRARYAGR